MKFLHQILALCFLSIFLSCENDVDINADFKEVTVVYGLLDQNSERQFIKINKTFLDDEKSALVLATDPSRIFYDSLVVSLIDEQINDTIFLDTISLPKDPGIFTNEKNILYYTDEAILPDRNYKLEITKPDGSITIGRTEVIDTMFVEKPRPSPPFLNKVAFVDRNFNIDRYKFEFSTGNNVAEFEVILYFKFTEIVGPDSILRRVIIPLTKKTNPTTASNIEFIFNFDGLTFFNAIEAQVPASTNPTKKVIYPNDNLDIEILAADKDFSFYREINGPIEGLAQTRPEFTNVADGYGLFSSRLSMIHKSKIDDNTRIYLVNEYKDTRNFSFP